MSSSSPTSFSTLMSTPSLLFLVYVTLSPLRAEVTSYYHSDLVLDFLCKPRAVPVFVRDVPWDCSSYVVCVRGKAVQTVCPSDELYNHEGRGRRCQPSRIVDTKRCGGQIFKYISDICQYNPALRIPSPESCSQYLDCTFTSGGTPNQNNVQTTQQQGQETQNQGRITQEQEGQITPDNGSAALENAPNTQDNWLANLESSWQTQNSVQSAQSTAEQLARVFESATQGNLQSAQDKGQANETSVQTNETSVQTTAYNKTESPFVNYLLECPYPLLFSPDLGECCEPHLVLCRGRPEPKAPCDYQQYQQLYNCVSSECKECAQHHPSCLKLGDGLHPVPGRDDMRMQCSRERTVDFITCPHGHDFVEGTSSDCVKV